MKPRSSPYQAVGRAISLSTLIPASALVGYVMGYFLDKWFGTHFLYIVFLLLGIASGVIQLIRDLTPRNDGKQ